MYCLHKSNSLNFIQNLIPSRSNPCINPMFMKNVNLSEYDEIFSNVNQKPQSDIVAELRKSMMMWNPKETVFEKRLDDVRECRSKLREEYGSDDDSDDDGIKEYFDMNNIREDKPKSSFPMKTERLLKSFKSFETKRIDDVTVELNGLKVIKVFEYKETSFSGIFGDGFKLKK